MIFVLVVVHGPGVGLFLGFVNFEGLVVLVDQIFWFDSELVGRVPVVAPFHIFLSGGEFSQVGPVNPKNGQITVFQLKMPYFKYFYDFLPLLRHKSVVVLPPHVHCEFHFALHLSLGHPYQTRYSNGPLQRELLKIVQLLRGHDKQTLLLPVVHVYLLHLIRE